MSDEQAAEELEESEQEALHAFGDEAPLSGTPVALLKLARVGPEFVLLPLALVMSQASSVVAAGEVYSWCCLLAAAWGVWLPDHLRAITPFQVLLKSALLAGVSLLLLHSVAQEVSATAVAAGGGVTPSLMELFPAWAWLACASLAVVALLGVLLRVKVSMWIALAPSRHIRGCSLLLFLAVLFVWWCQRVGAAAELSLRAG